MAPETHFPVTSKHAETPLISWERKEARKVFLLLNAALYRLLLPDAAMPAEVLLRLSVNGHCI